MSVLKKVENAIENLVEPKPHGFHNLPFVQPIKIGNDGLEALIMKEVKLPLAKETHEVCWEPYTKKLFVSQMTDSLLVELTCDEKGILNDEQKQWKFGWNGVENAGLHNVGVSYKHKGHLWLSLQYTNTLLLVDVRGENPVPINAYQVPTQMNVKEGDKVVVKNIGGPHCVRECPETHNIWACLKGVAGIESPCGKLSACCDRDKLIAAFEENAKCNEYDIRIPDSYAVWHCEPDKYNPKLEANGGTIYPCLATPPMIATDNHGNAWVAQDTDEHIMWINPKTKESKQLEVPYPLGTPKDCKVSGPGIMRCPDGSIWFTELKANCTLVRIDPDTKFMKPYEFVPPLWCKDIRLIHLDFCKAKMKDHYNRIYAIGSSLLDDDSSDLLMIINMGRGWKDVKGIRIIPLASQRCACHRVVYADVEDHDDDCDDGSVFITELTKSKVLQVKLHADILMNKPNLKYVISDNYRYGHRKQEKTYMFG